MADLLGKEFPCRLLEVDPWPTRSFQISRQLLPGVTSTDSTPHEKEFALQSSQVKTCKEFTITRALSLEQFHHNNNRDLDLLSHVKSQPLRIITPLHKELSCLRPQEVLINLYSGTWLYVTTQHLLMAFLLKKQFSGNSRSFLTNMSM